jgi:hypothetical protein
LDEGGVASFLLNKSKFLSTKNPNERSANRNRRSRTPQEGLKEMLRTGMEHIPIPLMPPNSSTYIFT